MSLNEKLGKPWCYGRWAFWGKQPALGDNDVIDIAIEHAWTDVRIGRDDVAIFHPWLLSFYYRAQ